MDISESLTGVPKGPFRKFQRTRVGDYIDLKLMCVICLNILYMLQKTIAALPTE